jgi:Rrf2 family protein
MVELALNHGNGPLRVRDIAKRQGISAKYIEQLIAVLKGAGLVNAVRGVHGGYSMAKPPSRVKMLEVFELLEGNLDQLECRGCPGSCSRDKNCVVRDVWSRVREAVKGVLEKETLSDMASRAKERDRQTSSIYYI